jgi:hypothetical protein
METRMANRITRGHAAAYEITAQPDPLVVPGLVKPLLQYTGLGAAGGCRCHQRPGGPASVASRSASAGASRGLDRSIADVARGDPQLQENRSFDHYFDARGIRARRNRSSPTRTGATIFQQPDKARTDLGYCSYNLTDQTDADLDHSFTATTCPERRAVGQLSSGQTEETMGYFTRNEIRSSTRSPPSATATTRRSWPG